MTTQAVHRTFVDRMIGAARLDSSVYEEVEGDTSATAQAAAIIVLAAIAGGIGVITQGTTAISVAVLTGLIGWVVYAFLAYWVGTNWFKGPRTEATWGELLRTLGFANTPRLLLIFGIVPTIGWIIQFVVFIWTLVTTVIAIRQALDFGMGEAIGTAVVAWIPYVVISLVLTLIVSIAV